MQYFLLSHKGAYVDYQISNHLDQKTLGSKISIAITRYDTSHATLFCCRWHLGHCRWECTPLYRGFDSFSGGFAGAGDYYEHTFLGRYDWQEGIDVNLTAKGTHSQVLLL